MMNSTCERASNDAAMSKEGVLTEILNLMQVLLEISFQSQQLSNRKDFPLYREIFILTIFDSSTMEFISILFVSLPTLSVAMASAIPHGHRYQR